MPDDLSVPQGHHRHQKRQEKQQLVTNSEESRGALHWAGQLSLNSHAGLQGMACCALVPDPP